MLVNVTYFEYNMYNNTGAALRFVDPYPYIPVYNLLFRLCTCQSPYSIPMILYVISMNAETILAVALH